MKYSYDVAIIGAGTAGLAALREVRKRTERFVLVNSGPYGTTCARVGCMPSKALIESANEFHRRKMWNQLGIRGSEHAQIDLPAVLLRVRELRDDFVRGVLKATNELGERLISGHARLIDSHHIQINGSVISAARIVLAPGSTPTVPKEWQALGDKVLTTDSLFEQRTLPSRIGVIGLGAIGVEMAQALSRLGIEVFAFTSNPTLAGLTDAKTNAALVAQLSKEFPIYVGKQAAVATGGAGFVVSNDTDSASVDAVLVAIGRRPNLQGLGLESLGVQLSEQGMPPVDGTTMQIANTSVFLAGDANGNAAVLHEAADEGHIAGVNAATETLRCFRRRVSMSIVFSDPATALIGDHTAFSRPDAIVGEVDFARQGKARIALRNSGVMRLYADRQSGKLLGAQLVAPAAEHMAHVLALAIDRQLSVHDLLRMPFYHPAFEEGMRTALRSLAKQLPNHGDSDLSDCEAFGVSALD